MILHFSTILSSKESSIEKELELNLYSRNENEKFSIQAALHTPPPPFGGWWKFLKRPHVSL